MNSKYLTPEEVGEVRRRTQSALANERKRGDGPPYVKDGRRVLYPSDELERWLKDNLIRPADPS